MRGRDREFFGASFSTSPFVVVVAVDAVDAAPPACTEASRSPESFLAIESISVRCISGSSSGRGFVRPRAAVESAADALLASVQRRAPPSRDEKRSESPSSNTRRAWRRVGSGDGVTASTAASTAASTPLPSLLLAPSSETRRASETPRSAAAAAGSASSGFRGRRARRDVGRVASTGLGTEVAPRCSGTDENVSGVSGTNATRRARSAATASAPARRRRRGRAVFKRLSASRPAVDAAVASGVVPSDRGPGDMERPGDRARRDRRDEAWLGNTAPRCSSMDSSDSSYRSERFSSDTSSPSPSSSRRTSRSRSRTRARYRSEAVHAALAGFRGLDLGVARGVTCGDTRGERTVVPKATACLGTRRAEGDGSRDRARPPSTEARRDAAFVLARGAGISSKNASERCLAAGSFAYGGRPRLILAGSRRPDGVSKHPLVRCGRPGAAHVVRAMRARRPPRHHSHPT